MLYLLVYLAVGLGAFCWVLAKNKAEPDDYLIPFFLLADPIGLFAWLAWPLSLLVYRADLKERVRLRAQSRIHQKTQKPTQGYNGRIVKTITRMSPSGKVDMEERIFEAISEDGYIEAGTIMVVVRSEGATLRVRKGPNQPPTTVFKNQG